MPQVASNNYSQKVGRLIILNDSAGIVFNEGDNILTGQSQIVNLAVLSGEKVTELENEDIKTLPTHDATKFGNICEELDDFETIVEVIESEENKHCPSSPLVDGSISSDTEKLLTNLETGCVVPITVDAIKSDTR